MPTRTVPSLPLLAGLLAAIPAAFAQTVPTARPAPDEVTKLSAFEVTTSRDIGYQSSNSAEVTRMNTPIVDIPMNVTVFNQQFMEDILARDTTDVLDYEASVRKTTENDGFLARGFSSVSANFLNGFAQPAGFGSQSVANVERVEVIKGPAAVLYGQGGYGATINRVTKRPLTRAQSALRASVGPHDSYRLAFDNTGPIPLFGGKTLLYRLNLEWDDGEVYRGTPNQRTSIAPSFTWNVTDRTQLTLEYIRDRHVRPGGWAFPMMGGDPDGIVTLDGAYRSFADRDYNHTVPGDIRQNIRQIASLDGRHVFSADLQFRTQFQYSDRDQHQVEIQPWPEALTILRDAVLTPRSWRDVPRGTENFRTRNELVAKFKTGPLQHQVLAGHAWDLQYDENKTSRSVNNFGGLAAGSAALEGNGVHSTNGVAFNRFPNLTLEQFMANPKLGGFNPNLLLPVNVFDPPNSPAVPPPAQRPPLFLDTWTHNKIGNRELYVNDLVSLLDKRLFIQLGMRHTETDRANLNRVSGTHPFKILNPNAQKQFSEADATTYSGGIVWHLDAQKRWSLYANANSSFQPEFRAQPDGSPLDPEEGNQREAGLKFSLRGGRLQGLVSVFDIRQENVTEADLLNPGYFRQLQGIRSTGLEVNLNTRLTERWMMFGSYAYVDARSTRTGKTQPNQARDSFTVFNRYTFDSGRLKGAFASLGTIYVGPRDSDDRSTNRNEPYWVAPGFWRFDVILGYRVPPRAGNRFRHDLALKVKNALDNNDMFFVISRDRYTPDAGREVELNLTTRF
jgi:iron complex outermembrane recepter protein